MGRFAWAVIGLEEPPHRMNLTQWILFTRGRIFTNPDAAWEVTLGAEIVVRLPDELEFEQSQAWYDWATTLIDDIYSAHDARPGQLIRLHPNPNPLSRIQVPTSFHELLTRFYHDGLLFVAQSCDRASSAEELYLQDCDWRALIEKTFNSPEIVKATWSLLWTTAGEMLEWYCNYGHECFLLGQRHKLDEHSYEATPQWREVDCVNDLLGAWSLVLNNSPDACYPKEAEPVLNYVFGPVLQHWRYLKEGRSGVLPQPPRIAWLRLPDYTKLPQGFYWRRQVRARLGKWFGHQDLIFYTNLEDAVNRECRVRSYKKVKQFVKF